MIQNLKLCQMATPAWKGPVLSPDKTGNPLEEQCDGLDVVGLGPEPRCRGLGLLAVASFQVAGIIGRKIILHEFHN